MIKSVFEEMKIKRLKKDFQLDETLALDLKAASINLISSGGCIRELTRIALQNKSFQHLGSEEFFIHSWPVQNLCKFIQSLSFHTGILQRKKLNSAWQLQKKDKNFLVLALNHVAINYVTMIELSIHLWFPTTVKGLWWKIIGSLCEEWMKYFFLWYFLMMKILFLIIFLYEELEKRWSYYTKLS